MAPFEVPSTFSASERSRMLCERKRRQSKGVTGNESQSPWWSGPAGTRSTRPGQRLGSQGTKKLVPGSGDELDNEETDAPGSDDALHAHVRQAAGVVEVLD